MTHRNQDEEHLEIIWILIYLFQYQVSFGIMISQVLLHNVFNVMIPPVFL